MMTPEGRVKNRVKALLTKRLIYHFSPMTHGYGASGVPDIIACHFGKFIAIECKAGNNKPTLLQQRAIDEIITNGGIALVINENNLLALSDALDSIERDGRA